MPDHRRHCAPFYLRRTKEAMVYFSDPQGNGAWAAKPMFMKRIPRTAACANPETEMTAMRVVMAYETTQRREVRDVNKENLGYDVRSLDLQSGELRLIEVKGLAGSIGSILLTPNERRVAEDRRDCYWLYVVTSSASEPELQESVRDPASFAWREVTKVQHYWLDVDAFKHPMQVRDAGGEYGVGSRP